MLSLLLAIADKNYINFNEVNELFDEKLTKETYTPIASIDDDNITNNINTTDTENIKGSIQTNQNINEITPTKTYTTESATNQNYTDTQALANILGISNLCASLLLAIIYIIKKIFCSNSALLKEILEKEEVREQKEKGISYNNDNRKYKCYNEYYSDYSDTDDICAIHHNHKKNTNNKPNIKRYRLNPQIDNITV